MSLVSIADLNKPIEVLTPYIEMAKKLSAVYDDFVLLEQDGHDREPGIHASELYPCLRKPVYSLMGVPRKPMVSKFWKQRFKVGKATHKMVQDDFHALAKRSQKGHAMRVAAALAQEMDCTVEFEDEAPVSPKHQPLAAHYQIFSSADGVFVFRTKATGEVVLRVGLEIKTESPAEYEKLKEPKKEHVRQAHLYMANLDLPLMWFFYINKGNQNNTPSTSPWLITWQPQVWEEIEARMQTVHGFVARGEHPERNEGVYCEFCPWKYTCQPSNMTQSQRPPSRKEDIRRPGA